MASSIDRSHTACGATTCKQDTRGCPASQACTGLRVSGRIVRRLSCGTRRGAQGCEATVSARRVFAAGSFFRHSRSRLPIRLGMATTLTMGTAVSGGEVEDGEGLYDDQGGGGPSLPQTR